MKNTKKLESILLCIVLGIIGVAVLYGVYLTFFDTSNPVIFKNLPFPTDKDTYNKGESISFYVSLEKHTDAPAELILTLVDGTSYSTQPVMIRTCGSGCKRDVWFTDLITIPNYAVPGVYHLEGYATYKVNPLRIVTVNFITQNFTITSTDAVENCEV